MGLSKNKKTTQTIKLNDGSSWKFFDRIILIGFQKHYCNKTLHSKKIIGSLLAQKVSSLEWKKCFITISGKRRFVSSSFHFGASLAADSCSSASNGWITKAQKDCFLRNLKVVSFFLSLSFLSTDKHKRMNFNFPKKLLLSLFSGKHWLHFCAGKIFCFVQLLLRCCDSLSCWMFWLSWTEDVEQLRPTLGHFVEKKFRGLAHFLKNWQFEVRFLWWESILWSFTNSPKSWSFALRCFLGGNCCFVG